MTSRLATKLLDGSGRTVGHSMSNADIFRHVQDGLKDVRARSNPDHSDHGNYGAFKEAFLEDYAYLKGIERLPKNFENLKLEKL